MSKRFIYIFAVVLAVFQPSFAQNNVNLSGIVSDPQGVPIEFVNIWVEHSKTGTITNAKGYYELIIPSNQEVRILFSYVEQLSVIIAGPYRAGSDHVRNVVIDRRIELSTFELRKELQRERIPMQKVDTRSLAMLPAATDKVFAIIKTLPGVSSKSELSSAYSVRGGNYDENLVYINDIEVHRPFIIRSGQQEGLPIINSDLVESIKFSAGGFEARYGDKLSSVLDIQYRTPKAFRADFSLSLLGASAHLEGTSKNHLFTYLAGARFRTTNYLLNTMDVSGDYNSAFLDFQSYFTYRLSPVIKLGYFSYFGSNRYHLIPVTRETTYGTHELALRLKVFFDGQEITGYKNTLNAFDVSFEIHDSFNIKLITSVYNTTETEYFDIMGQYWLNQLDTDPGSESFGDSIFNLGIGTFLDHARNRLFADIYSFQLRGTRLFKKSDLRFGMQLQHERITDFLREWRLIDSAGYSIPVSHDKLELNQYYNSRIDLQSMRYSAYLQNTFELSDSSNSFLTAGLRATYWDYNQNMNLSPRFQFVYEPNRKKNLRILSGNSGDSVLKKNIQLKASAGVYYQPPFYRELRNNAGVLNPEIRSQRSYHFVVGSDYYINLWGKTFKWFTEAYYKYLDDIIPYDIEDIRIRYHAKNNAKGYAMGIDMQLYGEFIGNLPSWASISLMSTKEDLDDDWYYKFTRDENNVIIDTQIIYPGYIPRPTDQRFIGSIFFQDFLPRIPTSKVHLTFIYGTPLPFGPTNFPQLRNRLRMRAYRRVDVGFSKLLVSRDENKISKMKLLNNFESVWISGEIFNLFGIENVISYFWIKDVNNDYWGVPNYLTHRRFNVNLTVKF